MATDKPQPKQFRNDVEALARNREVPWTPIEMDFGIFEAPVYD